MTKQDRKYVAILVVALVIAVAVEWIKPVPLNWSPNFQREATQPYGSVILFDLLPSLFPGADVRALDLPPYLVLRDTTRLNTTYLYLTDSFAPDAAEAGALVRYAERGNHIFIGAMAFEGPFADSLHLRTNRTVALPTFSPLDLGDDSIAVNFVNPGLRAAEPYYFKGDAGAYHFTQFDTLRATVLGTDAQGAASYIRMEVGQGALYLNTLPLAFTNYTLLDGTKAAYAYTALSYLPVQDVLWDAYYKPNRTSAATPLRYILSVPALRWSLWVLGALVVFFVFFEAKRRQRIVPILPPLKNATVDFVKTVGRLYYRHGDHANLAEKMIAYFLDYIRTQLRLPTPAIDDRLARRVAERSGVPLEEVRTLFEQIAHLRGRQAVTEAELLGLSHHLEAFYQHAKR